jgi:hypothetical protein
MEISWTDRVVIEVLRRIKEERYTLRKIERRKANWISYILPKNCFLKHVIKNKLEGTGRRRRRCRQLLGYLTKTRR